MQGKVKMHAKITNPEDSLIMVSVLWANQLQFDLKSPDRVSAFLHKQDRHTPCLRLISSDVSTLVADPGHKRILFLQMFSQVIP